MLTRFLDITISLVVIFLFIPLLAPVALILRFTGEGEIFYSQNRIGKDGRSFGVIKFATMLKDSPNTLTGTITIKNDPRVLPFGRFLRKTKINELPQLINIMIGDMSFIGPRPLTIENFNAYVEDVQNLISSTTPGLSGIGSIIFRDEEALLDRADNSIRFYHDFIAPYKGELECWYIQNNSLKIYFILIFLTVHFVIFPKSNLVWRIFPDLPKPPPVLHS